MDRSSRIRFSWKRYAIAAAVVGIAACGSRAKQPVEAGMGPSPALPPPEMSLIPQINVAKAVGWSTAGMPSSVAGTTVSAFAQNLDHPRWLYVLPNGDVLVCETNAPPRPDNNAGLRGRFFARYMGKAGGATPSANRITLLRDQDGDGVAEVRSIFLSGLNSPFGMALVADTFYVANTDAVMAFPYTEGETSITRPGVKVVDLPAGDLNHHWTKNLIASADGSTLFVAVGSNSNVAENGVDLEFERAAIWAVDRATGAHRVFASGLRNPVGMAWEPETGELWVAVNERDELGANLVPDYMTRVQEGGFYGWPYSYFGGHVDSRATPPRLDLVAQAIVPDYALGAHTASLGLAFASGTSLPPRFRQGVFVGQHGSWNRKPRSGYKVVFVPFAEGTPSGNAVDVLTGFLNDRGEAMGRPVGTAMDARGALLVADDVGNAVWRVAGTAPAAHP